MTILPDRRAQGLPEPLPLPLQILDAKPDCENHPGPARHIVAVHHVDCCTLPDLTPDGAYIHLLCNQCLTATTKLLTHYITRRLQRTPEGARIQCETCGRPIACVDDVMDVEAL